jgi:hypothetical protein
VEKFEVNYFRKIIIEFEFNILENKIYPENQEKTACVEYSKVYSPPEELQIPEATNKNSTMSESTISSSSNSDIHFRRNSPIEEINGITPGAILEPDSKSSSETITSVAKSFPK